jgi:hypothetical protein
VFQRASAHGREPLNVGDLTHDQKAILQECFALGRRQTGL